MKLDAIIILGAGLTKNLTLPREAKERLDKAIEIFYKHHPKYLITSGKYSYKLKKKPKYTESQLMKEYLIKQDIPQRIILKEEHSKDTFGNAYFTKHYVVDIKKMKNIAIVTSDYHIPKSAFLFRKIFGPNYTLHFIPAKSKHNKSELRKLQTRELMVKQILERYLSHIKAGDDKALRKFLYTKHPIYKGKSGHLFELFKKAIKALEPKAN